MSIDITLLDKDANQVLTIVQELRTQGLVQGKDFDFAFHQSRWDAMIGEIPKEAIFSFQTE